MAKPKIAKTVVFTNQILHFEKHRSHEQPFPTGQLLQTRLKEACRSILSEQPVKQPHNSS